MSAQKPTALVSVLLVCVLAGCSAGAGASSETPEATPTLVSTPSPTATPSPTPTPTPVATPTPEPVSAAQIVAVTKHFWWGGSANPCKYLECPITPRLAIRLAELIKIESGYKTGGTDLWCRCQNSGTPTITTEVTSDGGTATVTFLPGYQIDFLMVLQHGDLLLDDTQCTGRGASTSLYTSAWGTCE
jgi:hypothetical protein